MKSHMIETTPVAPVNPGRSGVRAAKEALRDVLPDKVREWLISSRPVTWSRAAFKCWVHRKQAHDEVYGKDYFEMVDSTTGRSAAIMADSIVEHLNPRSAADLGCGTGNLLSELRERGVKTRGAEYAFAALAFCRQRDLDVERIDFGDEEALQKTLGTFDLAISTEVAIQLSPAVARNYIEYLCRHSDTVLFSSPPCARDRAPKSPRTGEYWRREFARNGFAIDEEISRYFKRLWEEKGTAPWLHREPMIFRRMV